MNPYFFLRLEGLFISGSSLVAYLHMDGAIWLLVVLGLAPDLSMLGYLGGKKTGSIVYNVFHNYSIPLILAGYWLYTGIEIALLVSLIWITHIGLDRTLGYGLKYETGFKDTHLSTQPAPIQMLTEE